MNCYEFQDNISAYVEKELGLAQVRWFDKHVANCQACREAYEGVVSVIETLKSSQRVTVPDSFNARLRSRLERASSRPTRRIGRYFEHGRILGLEPKYAFASLVAALAIVVLSVNLFPEKRSTFSPNPIPLSTRQKIDGTSAFPGMQPQDQPARTFLADDHPEDTTRMELEGRNRKPNVGGKIKLVKDRE